jgi:hypothetical protein
MTACVCSPAAALIGPTASAPRPGSIKATSFLIDGEGIVYDGKGMPDFALLHSHK